MAGELGLPALLGPAGRHRALALALAMIISRVVAPGSKLSTLTWWADTTLGADLRRPPDGHPVVADMRCSDRAGWHVVCYGRVRIWDAATWQQRVVLTTDTQRVTLTRHPNQVEAVAIAPDATWLAAADLRSVHIWDTATGTQRAILTGPVRAMAIAPGGAWLATVGTAGDSGMPGLGHGHLEPKSSHAAGKRWLELRMGHAR